MKISIKEMVLERIDYRKLKPLQGGLKILTDKNYGKLKSSLESKGVFAPLFVWRNGKENFLLDGHGRERLFRKEKPTFLDAKGKETFEVPCVVIDAEDLEDAKQKLLLISSQFQSITQEGLDEFAADLDEAWVLNSSAFDGLRFDEAVAPEDFPEMDDETVKTEKKCPKCGYRF